MQKKSTAGGYREGAGRPKGTGKYGEKTQAIRVPVSLLSHIKEFIAIKQAVGAYEDNVIAHPATHFPISSPHRYPIPLYATRVAAGNPLPVDDYVERYLDLNQHLVEHPSATFFVRAEGESMINAGIHENDILIVDRSLEPTAGKIIIAVVNSELTVKRLEISQTRVRLMPENPRYFPIEITEEMDFRILGVVVHVIHAL